MVFIKTSFFFILSILTSGNSLVVQKGASNHGKNDNGGRLTKAKQAKEDQTLKAKSLEAQSNENVPRLVGFQQGVFNKDCLDFANSKYTHIIVAFVVTYTGFDGCTPAPDCYSCSTTCQLLPVARDLCKDASGMSLQLTTDRTDLTALQAVRDQISKWRGNNERKVLISIGGAGQDKCWSTKTTACKDNQRTLASDLANLVTDYGFDGVDIDYEVSPANKAESDVGQEDLDFLKEFTKSLRTRLPAEKLLSHSPRDDAMESKAKYFKSLQKDAEYRNSITWIQPQFYNGMRNVVKDGIDIGQADHESAKTIFGNLVKLFGDANKVGFGFCLKDCTPVATSTEAISVIQKIKEATNICAIGGVFMWELANDGIEGASWGNSVADEALKSSCVGPISPPIPAPVPIREVKTKKSKAKSPAIRKAKSPAISKAKSPKISKAKSPKTSASPMMKTVPRDPTPSPTTNIPGSAPAPISNTGNAPLPVPVPTFDTPKPTTIVPVPISAPMPFPVPITVPVKPPTSAPVNPPTPDPLDNFMLIISSDPQYHWYDGNFPLNLGQSWENNSNRMITQQYNSMKKLAEQNKKIEGVIINGDLTNLGKIGQWKTARSLIDGLLSANLRVFPSLGNHDYKNQFGKPGEPGKCGRWEGCLPDAARMVNAMRDWLDSQWNMKRPVTLNKAPLVFSDKKMCGSLAYSFDIGNIHVLQLQLHPNYLEKWSDSVVDTTHDHTGITYSITSSWDFMKNDLATARNAGKIILVFLHSYFLGDDRMTDEETIVFDKLMNDYKVSAIFAGHLHQSFGKIDGEYTSNVPFFRSGAASQQVYLAADIDAPNKKMTVQLYQDATFKDIPLADAQNEIIKNLQEHPNGTYTKTKEWVVELHADQPSTKMEVPPIPQLDINTC